MSASTVKLRWTANARCDVDYETLKLMRRAGLQRALGARVDVVLSKSAHKFVTPRTVEALTWPERVTSAERTSAWEVPAVRVPEFNFASVSEAV